MLGKEEKNFVKLFEKIVMLDFSWLKPMWTRNQLLLLRSTEKTQSDT